MTPQAVGCSGAARVLGISPRTFYDLSRRDDFPRPFVLPAERRGMRRWWVEEAASLGREQEERLIITVESNGQQFVLNYGADFDQSEAHVVSFILTTSPGGGPVISSFRVERAMPVEPLGLARLRGRA